MVKKVNIIITISCVLLLTFFIMFVVGIVLVGRNEGNIIYTIANISTNTSEQYYTFKVDGEYNIYSLNISSNNSFTGLIYPNYNLYSTNIDGKYVFSSVVDLSSNYNCIEITWRTPANSTLLLTIDTTMYYCNSVCHVGYLLWQIGLLIFSGTIVVCLVMTTYYIQFKKRPNKEYIQLSPFNNNKALNV